MHDANPATARPVLREYADQLTYSGRAKEAVPLFKEVLAGNLSDDEAARRARASHLPLLWSGQAEEAVASLAEVSSMPT